MSKAVLRRGSEWHRWDLHVHSPVSALANNFPSKDGNPDWEQYICAIENVPELCVLGITDYFSVEGYREVLKFKQAADLQDLLKNTPILPPESEADVKQLESLQSAKSDVEGKIALLNGSLSTIEELRALFETFEKQVTTFNTRVASLLRSVGLADKAQTLAAGIPSSSAIATVLNSRRDEIKLEVEVLLGGSSQALHALTHSITILREKLNLSMTRKAEYEKFQADKKSLERKLLHSNARSPTLSRI